MEGYCDRDVYPDGDLGIQGDSPHGMGKKQTGACSLRQPGAQELQGKRVFNVSEAYTQTWLKRQDTDKGVLKS